jgi:methylenetetrahydrofolate reductase (NADPH)
MIDGTIGETPMHSPTAATATARFLVAASVEIVPRDADPVSAIRRHLPAGMPVYIACVPGEEYGRIVALAAQLRRVGFLPVPHLTARGLASLSQLDDHLRRLAGEAAADQLLLLGGDTPEDRGGPFASSLEVLRTGLLARHGFTGVGLATYPEPHPDIPAAVLERELHAKLAAAAETGLAPWLVSQFSYDAGAIAEHARALRASGIAAPLRVGSSGPASWATMVRFAVICGFTNSVRHLAQNPARFGRLLTGFDPTPILRRLADTAAAEPDLGLAGPHFFSFGGAGRTAEFVQRLTAGSAQQEG